MAEIEQAVRFNEDLLCPICIEVLRNATTLDCGHSYCQPCITEFWDSQEPTVSCPECRAVFPSRRTKAVHALRNAADKARQIEAAGSADRQKPCPQHQHQHRDLSYFCETDLKLMCDQCQEGAAHQDLAAHVTSYKDALRNSLDKLQENEKTFTEVQLQQKHNISAVEEAFVTQKNHIKQCFAEMNQFIQRKEQSLMEKLDGRKENISKRMEVRLGEIQEQLTSIGTEIVKEKELMQERDDLRFLQGLSFRKKRSTEDFKALGDISEDLSLEILKSPLQYSVWKELRDVIKPGPASLTLNPVTASPWLILSEDLTSVTHGGERQQVPDDPQRFDPCPCVLSSDGFTSGKHYWEVKVGGKTTWTVGVARESVNRKGDIILSPPNGYWAVGLRNGAKYKAFTFALIDLNLDMKPKEIGIYLDYEGGQVSFYNADGMSHLYTFSDTFTEKLYPFFSPGLNHVGKNAEPLWLCHTTVTNPNAEEDGISQCSDYEREDATISATLGNARNLHLDWSSWKWAWLCFGLLVLLAATSPWRANFTETYLVCCSMLGFFGLCWALLHNRSLAGISWVYCSVLGYAGLCCLLLSYAGPIGACLVGLSLVGLLLASKGYLLPFWIMLSFAAHVGLVWLSDYDVWVWWVCCGLLGHAGLCLSLLGYHNVAEICWWCCGTKGYFGLWLLLLSFYPLAGVCWIALGIVGLCLAMMGYFRDCWIMTGLLAYNGVWCALVGEAELSAVTLGIAILGSCWSFYSR
ncbi:E3 ubiquitin-protein ligase TRIM69-like [Heterodontus francisci]|uniref:E3 ubiquitin-protein ligase TRIM69-like n=1 Tax=Heterodontus francisci TaxID=7792 RepID=UPI00355C9D5A